MPTLTTQGSLGAALAALLDRCLEAGMSYPMTLLIVGRNGSVVAARYPAPGEPPASLAEHMVGLAWGFRSTASSRTRMVARHMFG